MKLVARCAATDRARPVCASGASYDVVPELAIGTELSVTIARYAEYRGTSEGAQIVFEGTVTFDAAPQLISVVYDYSLSSLPDTALPAAHAGAHR